MGIIETLQNLRKQNPYFPLVPDYPKLSLDGQKQARLSALCKQDTPLDLVAAWELFCKTYLAQSKDAVFFKNGYQPSPEFHYQLIWDIASYGRNAYAAPRGSGKSVLVSVEMPLLLSLTRPFFEVILAMATDKQVEERFDQIILQIEQNELIREDFGVLKPKRCSAIFNHHHLHLTNGSIIKGLSVMGKKRGGRPRLFILDDPENDDTAESETSRLAVIEKFETILFRQIIPMLESGSSCTWIGTLISRKAFLYRAVLGDDDRFNYWNRKVLTAISRDDDSGEAYLLWPEKWTEQVLDARKEEIGASAFAAEYENCPISAQDRILQVDPRKNEYTVEGSFNWEAPLSNTNIVKWNERVFGDETDHRTYKEMQKPFNELVHPMFRFLLFDKAQGLTKNHDYSCIAICGMDTLATLWVLAMWLGRAKDDTLMRMIYEYGLLWQVRVLGIEAVSIQKTFAEALQEYVTEQGGARNDQWRGRVFPITYPAKETKAQRIASGEWRYNSGRIKYPAHLKDTWPYNQLYAQTQDFTMDLALLQFDDAIDTISMNKYVIKTRGSRFKREKGKPSLLERVKKGQPLVKGMPLLDGTPIGEITEDVCFEISKKLHRKNLEPKMRKIERKTPRTKR